MNEPDPTEQGPGFTRILRSLLRPLVRAMIAQGVTAPALYRLVKRLYVEVAEDSFGIDEERQTDSRISMLTGVHRRDVREFRNTTPEAGTGARRKITTLASVLGRWLADPELRGADGAPRALPRSADDGVSFEALVRRVSTDIRPRTVLDELERQGLVRIEDGVVHLRGDAIFGPDDRDQKVYFFAENVGDHIAAAVDNLLSTEPPFLERAVFYNNLTATSVNALEAEARRLAAEALMGLNETASEMQTVDRKDPAGTERFRFGVFFYRENEGPAPDTGDDSDEA